MSNTVIPVTQVALVAVKRQSIKSVKLPLFEDMGRHSNDAPIRIITAKPRKSTLDDCMVFCFFFSIGIAYPFLVCEFVFSCLFVIQYRLFTAGVNA